MQAVKRGLQEVRVKNLESAHSFLRSGKRLLQEDGWSANSLLNQGDDTYTCNDIIILPGYIDFPTDVVDLTTRLTCNTTLSSPMVSSHMHNVTESSMAAAFASIGGAGIIHCNNYVEEQAALVSCAKSLQASYTRDPLCLSPNTPASIAVAAFSGADSFIPVTEDGNIGSKLLGIVGNTEFLLGEDTEKPVEEFMTREVVCMEEADLSFDRAVVLMDSKGLKCLPLVTLL